MGFYDPADLVIVGEDGEVRDITSPKDLRLLPERVRRCIVGWSWDRKGNFTLKLAAKTPNLELIGRSMGMFIERKKIEFGELEKKSDAELDQTIVETAQQIAELEGVPVETVLAQLRGRRGDHDALMSNPRVMLARALQERAWRARRNRLKYYRPYEKQREFHAQGAAYRERLFCRQPAGQDVLRRLRDSDAPDGPIPRMVGGQGLSEANSRLGRFGVVGADARWHAASAAGPARRRQ